MAKIFIFVITLQHIAGGHMSYLIAVRNLCINCARRNDSMKNLALNGTSKW